MGRRRGWSRNGWAWLFRGARCLPEHPGLFSPAPVPAAGGSEPHGAKQGARPTCHPKRESATATPGSNTQTQISRLSPRPELNRGGGDASLTWTFPETHTRTHTHTYTRAHIFRTGLLHSQALCRSPRDCFHLAPAGRGSSLSFPALGPGRLDTPRRRSCWSPPAEPKHGRGAARREQGWAGERRGEETRRRTTHTQPDAASSSPQQNLPCLSQQTGSQRRKNPPTFTSEPRKGGQGD